MPRVAVNGVNIAYEERGQGEPLVLLMGLGADLNKWEEHVPAWEPHFRCLLVDNRGAGRSDQPPGPYTTRRMAEDTSGLLDALGIASAHVAGISMGSAVAQELALAHPDQVRSLVLISSWAHCDEYMQTVFEHFRKLREVASPADFTQLLQLWIFTKPYFATHQADLAQGQAEAGENFMPQAAYAAQCAACMAHDTRDRLHQITCPTLITVGDADIFTPLWCAVEIEERVPGAIMAVFPDTGHAHHWEATPEFNARVLAFLCEQG
jgi:pimeloyl-ACP methyl ester carboxylesterase